MCRHVILLLIVLAGQSLGLAADKLPEWALPLSKVPVDGYDLKETDAVILLDFCRLSITPSLEMKYAVRRAARILTAEGVHQGIEIIPLKPGSKITDVKASILYPNGEVTTIGNRDTVETQLFEYGLYADSRRKIISLPNPAKGCFVCFEYEVKEKLTLPYFRWYFQGKTPVEKSELVVTMTEGVGISWLSRPTPGLKPVVNGPEYIFRREKLKGIPAVPICPPMMDLVEQVNLHFLLSKEPPAKIDTKSEWQGIAQWYYRISKEARTTTEAVKNASAEICKGAATPQEKITLLCHWVQNSVRYVSIDIGLGGYIPHLPGDVYSNKYGDCKDKAFLLAALLQAQEIKSWPVLCRPRDDGAVYPEFPGEAFNHCILAIEVPGQGMVFCDPTAETVGYPYLPSHLANAWGLIVKEDSGELIPIRGNTQREVFIKIQASISANGVLAAKVIESYNPPAAAWIRGQLQNKTESERQLVWQEVQAKRLPGAKIAFTTFKGVFSSTAESLVVEYTLNAAEVFKKAGNMWLFKPFFIDDVNKPMLSQATRDVPLDLLDYATNCRVEEEISFPATMKIEEGIDPVNLVGEAGSFILESSVAEGKLNLKKTLVLKDISLPVGEYARLQKFFSSVQNVEESEVLFAAK